MYIRVSHVNGIGEHHMIASSSVPENPIIIYKILVKYSASGPYTAIRLALIT